MTLLLFLIKDNSENITIVLTLTIPLKNITDPIMNFILPSKQSPYIYNIEFKTTKASLGALYQI